MAQLKNEEQEEKQEKNKKCPGWDLMHEESKQLLSDPSIVCQIKRSKNDNRVMYQANVIEVNGGKKQLDPNNPLKVFWLKIEPSYIQKRRAQGIKHDKTDLTFLENNMAYGISVAPHGDAKKNEFKITFVALKERPGILKIDPKDGKPKIMGTVKDDKGNRIEAVLTDMFVQTKENWVGLPTVNYIVLSGKRYDNGQAISEQIKQ